MEDDGTSVTASLVDKHASSLSTVGDGQKRGFCSVLRPHLASFQPALAQISSTFTTLAGRAWTWQGGYQTKIVEDRPGNASYIPSLMGTV